MQTIIEETKYIMKKYGITASKSLGQNFLIDEEVIQKTIDVACITKQDIVIEIGPGIGTLTSKLLEKAGKVIAIELDERMTKMLTDRFKLYNNFKLIQEDVLKVNLNKLIEEEKISLMKMQEEKENLEKKEANSSKEEFKSEKNKVKVVANLPYYITTPIIMKLLEEKLPIESIVVMVQKEVADRLTDIPGGKNTGAITYCVYYYSKPEKVINVKNTSFIPAPEVNSEVIKLTIRENPPVNLVDEKLFFKVIKTSFMQRRKTLINSLTNGKIAQRDTIRETLKKIGIEENIRGEKLTINQFAEISNLLAEDILPKTL